MVRVAIQKAKGKNYTEGEIFATPGLKSCFSSVHGATVLAVPLLKTLFPQRGA